MSRAEERVSYSQLVDSVAAGRLLMRRMSEARAAKVIFNLEGSRYRAVMAQCSGVEREKMKMVQGEYFSMVAVSAVILKRYDVAQETASMADRLPWPRDPFFSRLRQRYR